MLRVVVHFRGAGWQYPLREGDVIRVEDAGRTLAELPGELVIEAVRQLLERAALAEAVRPYLDAGPRLRVPTHDRPVRPMKASSRSGGPS